ncbi:MAG: DUF3244 domain-containing protein [Alistipes sp.]|nr:DUF3244 domain-containing protein [Alistipes sp.]
MRKITILLLSILCVTFGAYSLGDTPTAQKAIPITLKGKKLKLPRTGDLTTTVECYYYDGRVYVDFYAPVEDVEISVTSIYTGEQYDTFASGMGQYFYVDVPTTSGQYYVEIESDSATWCGEYYL